VLGRRGGDHAVEQRRLAQRLERMPGAARLAGRDHLAVAGLAQRAHAVDQVADRPIEAVVARIAIEAIDVPAVVREAPDIRMRRTAARVSLAGIAVRPHDRALGGGRAVPEIIRARCELAMAHVGAARGRARIAPGDVVVHRPDAARSVGTLDAVGERRLGRLLECLDAAAPPPGAAVGDRERALEVLDQEGAIGRDAVGAQHGEAGDVEDLLRARRARAEPERERAGQRSATP
jgi:hypothetical protein